MFDHNRGLLYHGAFCAEKPLHSFLHIVLFVSKRLMFSIIGTSHHEDTLNHGVTVTCIHLLVHEPLKSLF